MSDTDFNPKAARLDQETEAELYALYRAYFAEAEDHRNWNVWDAVPWETVPAEEPSEALVAAVMRAYEAELFLPDYMTVLLKFTRSSRARAWYVTRWAYEEGKHLLALGEWVTRRGLFSVTELQDRGEEVLATNRWQPVSADAVVLFVDALLYETQEVARYREVRRLAEAEGDSTLTIVADFILRDEEAQARYFAEALRIIDRHYAEKLPAAVAAVADAQPDPDTARRLLNGLLDLSAA